jgi:hypothetical protein
MAQAAWSGRLTYRVPSRTDPHETYECELTSYHGNGRCPCRDFEMRFEPLLRRMVSPEAALREGLVKQREYQREGDVLRCEHLVQAHDEFHRELMESLSEVERVKAERALAHGFHQA